MAKADSLEIFLAAPPGLEPLLAEEATEQGFDVAATEPGGVTCRGGWPEVWRANLALRGASRVLVRIGEIRASHLAKLDKRARGLPWAAFLRPDRPVAVEATSKRSRLYHTGAIAQRIAVAIAEELGAPAAPPAEASVTLQARMQGDVCTISVDASGAPLHKRGFKQAVVKAPLRETMAALFLRACGFRGAEPLLDPMCGSGTFVLEAAERTLGLAPGRGRGFAFEHLASFDPAAWARLRDAARPASKPATPLIAGFDRDPGAVSASRANAERAGLADVVRFEEQAIGALERPEGPPGLVIANPPYGGRIGETGRLRALYAAFGERMRAGFAGWRVGLVTSDQGLARATGLPFERPGPPIPHGGLQVRLYRTAPLG